MRNFIFIKYKPKLSMHWITNKNFTYGLRNEYVTLSVDTDLHEYTTYEGYMCDDYRIVNTTFCKPIKIPLKSVTDMRSSMRSLNFSSYRPFQ